MVRCRPAGRFWGNPFLKHQLIIPNLGSETTALEQGGDVLSWGPGLPWAVGLLSSMHPSLQPLARALSLFTLESAGEGGGS